MTPKTLKRTLVIKERLRKWRQAELMQAEAQVEVAQQLVAHEEARREQTAGILTRGGEVSAHELVLAADQLQRVQRALEEARKALGAREQERDARKDAAGEATREVKAIEVLYNRLLAEQRREADRREQAELDEAATRRTRSV